MTPVAVMYTFTDTIFHSTAPKRVQQNSHTVITLGCMFQLSDISETEHVASDSCCCVIRSHGITYGSPRAVVEHLKSSFSWIAASIKSDVYLITGDSDVFTVLTVVNAPAAV